MLRNGVSNVIATGLLIAGVLIGSAGFYVVANYQAKTVTQTETSTTNLTTIETSTQPTTIIHTITQPTTITQTATCTVTTKISTGAVPSYNPANLFGNYSKMTVSLNDTYKDNSGVRHTTAVNISYDVLGQPLVNATLYYRVNVTEMVNMAGVQGAASFTFWFAPNGTLSLVQARGVNYTGSQTTKYELTFLIFQEIDASSNPTASGSLQQAYVHQLNTTMTMISGYPESVSYYVPNSVPFSECGTTSTVNSEVIGVGTISGSTNKLFVYLYGSETPFGALNPTTILVKVTAVTKA